MHYSEVVELLNESGLSPEGIASRISVSNSTYRRWLKAPGKDRFPEAYRASVSSGVYKLLGEGQLDYDSPRVNVYLRRHLPEFFQAAISGLHVTEEVFADDSPHQDKITAVLSHLGNSSEVRRQVDKSAATIKKFASWGESWRLRTQLLSRVIKAKTFTLVDKLVAYGALFYLILPFDLIPDPIAVFGYIDDFGILGFGTAYYTRKFPHFDQENHTACKA